MSPSWRPRVVITVVCWLLTCIVMAAMDLGPRPVLLAGIAAVLVSVLSLMLDMSDIAAPVTWGASYETESSRGGTDLRLRALQRQLSIGASMDDGHALHGLLVELIDDQLNAAYGIDRAVEPDRAATALGPTLADFVTAPSSTVRLGDPRVLSSILTHIESIETRSS